MLGTQKVPGSSPGVSSLKGTLVESDMKDHNQTKSGELQPENIDPDGPKS